jgi:two-component system LytT family response regulator
MEYTLEALQGMLSPVDFYRANRQFIIAREAVADISVWFGSRLSVNLKLDTPEKIVVSKARVPEFKQWLINSAK